MPEQPPTPADPRRPSLDDLLDRSDPAAKAELQRLVGQDADAKRHAQLQGRIDVSLRAHFAEPELALTIPAAASKPPLRWKRWAAAAVLVLAALGAWRVWTVANRPDVLGPLYRQTVDSGFKPETVCTTDEEFSSWCRAYLRQALYPQSRPDTIEYVGWNKGRVISPISGVLLVKACGDPVIIVLERSDRQTVVPGAIADRGLHSFSRRIGDVVLYEVTPKTEATVLPLLGDKPAPKR